MDRALVDRTMALLVAHDRAAIPWRREVGAAVLDGFFVGDGAKVRSWQAARKLSFQELAKRMVDDATAWSEMSLRRAVWAEIVARALPRPIGSELAWSYLWRLHAVWNLKTREALARRILAEELVGRAARDAIDLAAARERGDEAPGRPAAATVMRRIKEILDGALANRSFDAGALRRLGETQRSAAIEATEELIATAKTVLAKLKGR